MFKKIVSCVLIVCVLSVIVGCGSDRTVCLPGADEKQVCKTYGQYGMFNATDMKNQHVQYRVIVGNVVWAIILVETIFTPIIIFGWYLYEPLGPRVSNDNGVIQN